MSTLQARIVTTVDLLHRRGYAVTVKQLSHWLVGGEVSCAEIHHALGEIETLCLSGELVHGRDVSQSFIERALRRQEAHCHDTSYYWPQVMDYVTRLTALCPQIQCVALAGSMSSGGFVASDDVDFNLFVADGTRYTTYLVANLLALPFSFANRKRSTDAHTQRLFIPKLMSINVIWTAQEAQPFQRQDGPMALELLLSRPIYGEGYFQQVLAQNTWLQAYFPQLHKDVTAPEIQFPVHHISPWLEKSARLVTYGAWRYVMWTRRNNPEALARVAYVRQCQHPYALFEAD